MAMLIIGWQTSIIKGRNNENQISASYRKMRNGVAKLFGRDIIGT